MQVQVVGNGEYVTNELECNDSPNFLFDLVIVNTELEVIVPASCKTYEVFADYYGKNPMRWFSYSDEGCYVVREDYDNGQCKKCLDPE